MHGNPAAVVNSLIFSKHDGGTIRKHLTLALGLLAEHLSHTSAQSRWSDLSQGVSLNFSVKTL